jgi:hypothetical protein
LSGNIWVDFNDVTRTGTTWTYQKEHEQQFSVGESVIADDWDGNLCDGVILKRQRSTFKPYQAEGWLYHIQLNMETFRQKEA